MTSRAFRQTVLETFPAARSDVAFRRLLLYLLLCGWNDAKHTERTVLDYATLAACADETSKAQHRNFDAQLFLERFEAQVIPLHLQGAKWSRNPRHRAARTALPDWPDSVAQALQAELSLPSTQRRQDGVYFVSGKNYCPHKHRDSVAREKRKAGPAVLPPDHPALHLMQYANNQQPTVFNRLIDRNIDHARAVAQQLTKHDSAGQLLEEATAASLVATQRILLALEGGAMPHYRPSRKGRTARIFAGHDSYLGLPRDVRRALMPDCPELDLGNAQLAVAARDWDIPEVQAFLATGQKIWPKLERHFGLPAGVHKPLLKSMLYSLLFGRSKNELIQHLAYGEAGEGGIGLEKARTLFDDSLIRALYEARETQLSALVTKGAGTTCFGQELKVGNRKEAQSVLAALAQARELWLLLPAVELIMQAPDLVLIAWQHDGFTIHSSRPGKYVRQLQQAVNQRASQGGYHTTLERTDTSLERRAPPTLQGLRPERGEQEPHTEKAQQGKTTITGHQAKGDTEHSNPTQPPSHRVVSTEVNHMSPTSSYTA